METLNLFVFFLISGIFVFFFGLNIISNNLSKLLNAKYFIKFNQLNPFLLLLIGIFISSITQSTSASLSIMLPFIHNNLINPINAIYLLLGFNIGTSSTLVFNTFDKFGFSFLLFLVFIFLYIIKKRDFGFLVFGICLIFFSLGIINKSIVFLLRVPFYFKFMTHLSFNYFYPFFIGCLSSLLVQSSSVVLSTFQGLYIYSNVNLSYFVLVSLGGNIGSTITGIVGGMKFKEKTKLVVFFNVFYNLAGSIIFLIFLNPFTNSIIYLRYYFNLSKSYDMAICHFLINSLSSLFFLPFVKHLYIFFDYYLCKI